MCSAGTCAGLCSPGVVTCSGQQPQVQRGGRMAEHGERLPLPVRQQRSARAGHCTLGLPSARAPACRPAARTVNGGWRPAARTYVRAEPARASARRRDPVCAQPTPAAGRPGPCRRATPRDSGPRPSRAGSGSVCLSGACATCNPGATQCSGDESRPAVERRVGSGGRHANQACVSGAAPASAHRVRRNARARSTASRLRATATGNWQTAVPCTNEACVNGSCSGVCAPGASQCSSSNPLWPQACSSSGTWGNTGSTCAYVFAAAGRAPAPASRDRHSAPDSSRRRATAPEPGKATARRARAGRATAERVSPGAARRAPPSAPGNGSRQGLDGAVGQPRWPIRLQWRSVRGRVLARNHTMHERHGRRSAGGRRGRRSGGVETCGVQRLLRSSRPAREATRCA